MLCKSGLKTEIFLILGFHEQQISFTPYFAEVHKPLPLRAAQTDCKGQVSDKLGNRGTEVLDIDRAEEC